MPSPTTIPAPPLNTQEHILVKLESEDTDHFWVKYLKLVNVVSRNSQRFCPDLNVPTTDNCAQSLELLLTYLWWLEWRCTSSFDMRYTRFPSFRFSNHASGYTTMMYTVTYSIFPSEINLLFKWRMALIYELVSLKYHKAYLPNHLTHCGLVELRKWAIFNTIVTSQKSWLSQEDLDASCE